MMPPSSLEEIEAAYQLLCSARTLNELSEEQLAQLKDFEDKILRSKNDLDK